MLPQKSDLDSIHGFQLPYQGATSISPSDSPSNESNLRLVLPILAFTLSAIVLLNNLDSFPLYFFCDEAIHGVEADSLLSTGRESSGARWPLFFQGYGTFHISISVYLHLLVQTLIPKSEFSVRLVGVISGLFFSLALAGVISRLQRAIAGTENNLLPFFITLITVVTSAFFFLHFRTGFEFVVALATWMGGIYFFDKAFSSSSTPPQPSTIKFIGVTSSELIFGALSAFCFASCFYLYTPGRGWTPLTLGVLSLGYFRALFSKKILYLLFGVLFTLLLTPYLLTMLTNPQIALGRLQIMGITSWQVFIQKLDYKMVMRFIEITSPAYWLSVVQAPPFESSERHIIPGLPHLPTYLIPFTIIGICTLLKSSVSNSLSRSLLLLYPIGAFPAVLIAVNPLRCAPIGALILAYGVVGICAVFDLCQRYGTWVRATSLTLVTVLCCYLCYLQRYIFYDAVRSYDDYGFYGLQMGEHKVFEITRGLIQSNHKVSLSHAAFNGNEMLVHFYLNQNEREQFNVEVAHEPCIISPLKKLSIWIVREEVYETFLKRRSECSTVTLNILDTVTAPNGEALFRVIELEQGEISGFQGPPA